MGMVQAAILRIAGTLLAVQFKSSRPEYGIYLAVTVSILIFAGILGRCSALLDAVREIGALFGGSEGYITTLIKMIGITYTSELAASICRDAGYQTIAVQIELFGKLMLLTLCIPVILTVFRTIGEFLP